MIYSAPISPPARHDRLLQRSRDAEFTMNSDVLTGMLLRMLAASKRGAAFLELGTGCGVGTCWILDGMDAQSTLVSIDTDANTQTIARDELDYDRRLTLRLGDAAQYLVTTTDRFDFIYADAWPGKYSHLDEALALLNPGGIYLVDDMLPQPNWPDDHAPKARALATRLLQLDGFAVTMLEWSTGLIVCVKR
jgi:predicted O-methyltransferase YrrM